MAPFDAMVVAGSSGSVARGECRLWTIEREAGAAMKHFLTAAVTFAAIVMWSGSSSASNLVMNPGFETGDLTDWTFTAAASGSDFFVGAEGAHSGTYAAWFGAVTPPYVDTISQVLPTVSGDTYTFSFWLQHTPGVDENTFQAYWGGTTVYSVLDIGTFAYTQFTFTEVASGPTTIAFAGYEVPSWFQLDDVSVTPSAVPEPTALTLAGIAGLAGLAYSLRRRFRAV